MKTKTLLAMGLCAAIGLLGLTTTVLADEKKHDQEHKEGHDKGKVKIPATVDGIMKEIHHHHQELAATVKNKKLADVHHHAFAIRDLAKALPPKADASKKAQVEGTVKNISKLAEDLDASGDGGDQARTEANLKKMDGMLTVLFTQFGMKMEGKEGHKH